MIDVHFWPTGNGKKVIILLEECGLPYRITPVNIGKGEPVRRADYLKIAPNNRMPAIISTSRADGAAPRADGHDRRSGAITMYIAEKAGKFGRGRGPTRNTRSPSGCWWRGLPIREARSWAKQGHFLQSRPGSRRTATFAMPSTGSTTRRTGFFGVLNLGLHGKDWLAAGEYSIADMICYPWSIGWKMRGLDIEEFPNVKRWLAAIEARPAVAKAMAMGPEFTRGPGDRQRREEARRSGLLANQRAWPVPAGGVGLDTGTPQVGRGYPLSLTSEGVSR